MLPWSEFAQKDSIYTFKEYDCSVGHDCYLYEISKDDCMCSSYNKAINNSMGAYPLWSQFKTGALHQDPLINFSRDLNYNKFYDNFKGNFDEWRIPGILTKRKPGDTMGDVWNVYRAAGLAAPLLFN